MTIRSGFPEIWAKWWENARPTIMKNPSDGFVGNDFHNLTETSLTKHESPAKFSQRPDQQFSREVANRQINRWTNEHSAWWNMTTSNSWGKNSQRTRLFSRTVWALKIKFKKNCRDFTDFWGLSRTHGNHVWCFSKAKSHTTLNSNAKTNPAARSRSVDGAKMLVLETSSSELSDAGALIHLSRSRLHHCHHAIQQFS